MHPDSIGPYRIDRKIGSGGMGNVYHGTHAETGHGVAVKVLPSSMARESGFVQRFSREIDALRKVNSPNIVKIFEDGQTEDGSYYFSMEYVDGETLTSMVSRRKRIPWPEVIDIAMQIATALKAAHNEGIVHRDLKPSNLMITSDGQVKLADFGVAHVFATTRLTRTGGVVGTAEYMSPEQARGQRATRLSDLYSLGAVMYVMLTGRPPFTGKLASDILHKHQYSQFDKPGHYVPELPRLLEDFVCKLLEKKPENRIPDALVAIRQLNNIRSRIEFEERQNAERQTAVSEGSADRTAGLASDRTEGRAEFDRNLPGPATMVRDAIRADIEARTSRSVIGKFFDNTLVLILLLALVIAAGVYLSRTSVPTPEQRFADAKEIMTGKAGMPWLRARDDLVVPLLAEQTLSEEQQQQLLVWKSLADQFEFCRGLDIATPSTDSAQSELQRLILRSFNQYSEGEVAEAAMQLQAVRDILTEQDSYLREFISSTLTDWKNAGSITGRTAILQRIIDSAQAATNGSGDVTSIIQQLDAVQQLYGNDNSVTELLKQCENLSTQLQTRQE